MTSELRHRSTHASPPASPPHLTRSFTEDTLSYSIPHDELSDLFSGLNLLDLLVMVQAHIELWSRGLRRTSSGWKTKADRLVEESKVLAAAKLKATERRDAFMASSSLFGGEAKDVVFSAKDRERLEKRYREIRGKTRDSLKRLLRKWEEEKTVRLRDKVSFFFGVMNVLVSALLLGFAPTWIPLFYTVQVCAYLPLRVYEYKKRAFHYFLFDLCYAINLLCLVYLWIFPENPYLFEACYGLALGSLGTAIATWRNSLVFHSLDKVISLAIHILPPFVFTTIRHFYPNANERYPALKHLVHLRPWRSIAINMTAYLLWQLLYYRWIIVARSEKIKQGRTTSFTFLINDKKHLIGKIAAKVPEGIREVTFMAGQAVYTFVTLLLPIFVLYDSKFWSSVYLLILFSISVWNGASFYMEVFSRKFEKELIALRKEFDLMASTLSTSGGSEGSGVSMGMSRSASLDEGSGMGLKEEEGKEVGIVGEIVQ